MVVEVKDDKLSLEDQYLLSSFNALMLLARLEGDERSTEEVVDTIINFYVGGYLTESE